MGGGGSLGGGSLGGGSYGGGGGGLVRSSYETSPSLRARKTLEAVSEDPFSSRPPPLYLSGHAPMASEPQLAQQQLPQQQQLQQHLSQLQSQPSYDHQQPLEMHIVGTEYQVWVCRDYI